MSASRFVAATTLSWALVVGAAAVPAHASRVAGAVASKSAADPGAAIARGRYIVDDVALCWRCHTPIDSTGSPDRSRWLMGAAVRIRPSVPTSTWAVVAPRLAGSPPGTDAQFVMLLMTGISRTGAPPRPPMPQFRMTRADAEAVLAYVKSLGPEPWHTQPGR